MFCCSSILNESTSKEIREIPVYLEQLTPKLFPNLLVRGKTVGIWNINRLVRKNRKIPFLQDRQVLVRCLKFVKRFGKSSTESHSVRINNTTPSGFHNCHPVWIKLPYRVLCFHSWTKQNMNSKNKCEFTIRL